MNVQNLREKFNQPGKGSTSISSPGTSFGVTLKSTTKPPPSSANKNASPFSSPARVAEPQPHFCSVKLRSSKSPSPERVASTLGRNSAHLRSSKSPSPDPPLVNGAIGARAATTNGDCGARAHVKSPEQTQQEVILRKWNRSSSANEDAPTTVDSPALAKSKKCVSRFVAHLATTTAPDATTGCYNDATAADNGLSVDSRADRQKSPAESSVPTSRAYGERHCSAPANSATATAASAMAARPANTSFLHNDVRPSKVAADLGSTNGPPLKATANSVPAPFVAQNSSPKLHSAADRWKPAPVNSEPEFRRVALSKGESSIQFLVPYFHSKNGPI